jgi:hypothetical protein
MSPYSNNLNDAEWAVDVGLIDMFKQNLDYFRDKPLDMPKTTILLDNGYHPERIRKELEKVYPEIGDKLQFELSPKPSKQEKLAL